MHILFGFFLLVPLLFLICSRCSNGCRGSMLCNVNWLLDFDYRERVNWGTEEKTMFQNMRCMENIHMWACGWQECSFGLGLDWFHNLQFVLCSWVDRQLVQLERWVVLAEREELEVVMLFLKSQV